MPKQVVLIGHPVAQSLSGVLQQSLFDELGIDAQYELRDTLLIDLPDVIASLRGDDSYLGANIAFPYKDRVLSMVDRLAEEAHATGAIDTLTREQSRLVGHNTDVVGLRIALDALVGKQKMPKAAVVLGAGGGARAAVYALITGGFQRVVVFNRHLHRAEGLVKHFARSAAHMELRALPWHESVIEAELAKTKVLINASNSPDAGNTSPVPAELLPPELMVLDLTYVPRETRLLRDAQAAAAVSTLNGDLMLIHQTAAAFGLWTGRKDAAIVEMLMSKLDDSRGGEPMSVGTRTEAEPAAVAE